MRWSTKPKRSIRSVSYDILTQAKAFWGLFLNSLLHLIYQMNSAEHGIISSWRKTEMLLHGKTIGV